jgi:2-iminobutanoate/2-iminopropanoate deaminase
MDSKVLPTGLPFSAYTRQGELLFLSGMLGHKPQRAELVEGGVAAQTRQALAHIDTLLRAQGLSLDNVLKAVIYLTDLQDWETVNGVWREYFKPPYPARSAVAVSALMLNASIEIEVIASTTAVYGTGAD